MKFVCDRCQTRYSIADEKVRGKILKVRCKSCQNIITVRETGAAGPDAQISVADLAPPDRTILAPLPAVAAAQTSHAARPADVHRPPAAPAPRTVVPPPAPPPAQDGIQWFLSLDGKQGGPLSRKALLDKLAALPVDADVHVWNERMDGWKPPEQVTSLARELQTRRRPVPPLPGAGHAGPHAVPGVPGRTITGSQPVVPAAAAGRRPSRALPIPAGSVGGAAAGGDALPLAAATEPVGNGAHAPASRSKKGHPGGLGALNGSSAAVQIAPASLPLTLDPNDVPEMPDDPAGAGTGTREALVSSTLAPTAGTDVAHPSANWQSTSVPLVATPVRSRSTKLILGSLGIVTVVIVLVTFALTRKTLAPTPLAEKPKATAPGGDEFTKLADQLAPEKGVKDPVAANQPAPPTVAPLPTVEPAKPESTSVVRGTKGKLKKNGKRRDGGRGVGQVQPPAFTGATTGAAVADNSAPSTGSFGGPERKVALPGGGSARSAPSQTDIMRVINNNKAGIKVCYQRALLRDNTLTRGKIVVKLTLGLSGKVKSVVIDGPQPFLVLQPCIKEMVSRWGFPPSSEEYGTEFAYVFQGNE